MGSSRCTGGSDRNNPLGRWLVDNMPRGIELEVPERRDRGRKIPFVDAWRSRSGTPSP